MEKEQKPTIKTTEFITIAVVAVSGLLLSFGVFSKNEMLEVAGYLGALVSSVVHHFNRTKTKIKEIEVEDNKTRRRGSSIGSSAPKEPTAAVRS